MTEHDEREQRKEVLMLAHEAQRKLDAIKVKAERIGGILLDAANILKDDPAKLLTEWRERAAKSLTSNTSAYSDTIFSALNHEALFALAKEYQEARARLDEVNSQKELLRL